MDCEIKSLKVRSLVHFVLIGLLGLFILAPCIAGAQERLRIAYAGGASVVPVWIVQEKGLLKRQGIGGELIQISASTTALQALLAGEVELVVTSAATLVSSRLAGVDVIMIMAIVPTFPSHVMASRTITDVSQLKGKIGGVNRFGTNTDLGLRLTLKKYGLDPERDVKLVPVGGTSQMVAALLKGIIQFGLFTEPFVRETEKLGFKSLVDVGSLKIPFHWNGVLTRESTIKSKRPLIAKFVRAMTEAIYIFKTEKEWTTTIISKYLKINDPEGLERTYNSFSVILPEIPYPTPEGVKILLDDMMLKNPKVAETNPKEFVDMSFVQELDRSGSIKKLYGK